MSKKIFGLVYALFFWNVASGQNFVDAAIEVNEGNKATVKIAYTGATYPWSVDVTIDYASTSAGMNDYAITNNPQTVTFSAANQTPQIILIDILSDDNKEVDESITLAMSVAGSILPSKCVIKILDKDNLSDFFWGAVGGNINFASRAIQVNSIYSDIQFNPRIFLNETHSRQFVFPIRLYYNNGSGPQQIDYRNPQRFITIDEVTLAQEPIEKVRYWDERTYLIYKTETSNLGINIPFSYSGNLKNNPNWSLIAGLNFDIAKVVRRQFDYSYSENGVTITDTVKSVSDVPLPQPETLYVSGNNTVVRSNRPFYKTSQFRPPITVPNQEFSYFQIYTGIQVGAVYDSPSYRFSAKYSLGGTTSFAQDRSPFIGGYRHIAQIIFIEKGLGLQLFVDLRIPKINENKTSPAFPEYYVSISKTLNIGKLKEVFFP